MEAFGVALIFGFDEVYERLSVTARLFDKIHITHDPCIRKSFHCVLESRYWRYLGDVTGELYLSKLLIDVFINTFRFYSFPRCKVCCPPSRR